jgi:ABC-type bacteriocin/lantibiotic exporter with double-glycine peptidase domain
MILPIPTPISVADVPFYSQFVDIKYPPWQKVGCGVTSLAMLIDYYTSAVSVNTLLGEATSSGAYDTRAGWTYQGLINVAKKYSLSGTSYDLGSSKVGTAFAQFKTYLADGPVMASVHYKFDPKSTIPHLVVIDRLVGDTLYYNDPAAKAGEQSISVANFEKGWKKRFLVFRPTHTVALANK